MNLELFRIDRKSYLREGDIYFWTATVNSWHKLLAHNRYKEVVVNSLQYLSDKKLIDVFAFVIMPNHIHLIWRIKGMNGKETPQGSFLKYTAHEFKKMLAATSFNYLQSFRVTASNKQYEFWQRDSLAIQLYTKEVAYQKLDYLHNNPLAEHWNLATDPTEYYYSSARFYEDKVNNFAFLKDLRSEF